MKTGRLTVSASLICALVVSLVCKASFAEAPLITEVQRIGPIQDDFWSEGRGFGSRIAVDESTIVLGVPELDQVFIYTRDSVSWIVQQLEAPSYQSNSPRFGESVAISGDTLLVGASLYDIGSVYNSGAAFVYRRIDGRWEFATKLIDSEPAPIEYFGSSVALKGGFIAIGAPNDSVGSQQLIGSVTLFHWDGSNWVNVQKVTHSDPQGFDKFGTRVALSDSSGILLVSSPRDDDEVLPGEGSVTIFERTGALWNETGILRGPDGPSNSAFGYSIVAGGQLIVIGDPNVEIAGGFQVGAAYVYSRDGQDWSLNQRLLAGDAYAGQRFATTLDLSGEFLAAGAPYDSHEGISQSGSVYFFAITNTTFAQIDKVVSPRPNPDDHFGAAVALDGDLAVFGATGEDNSRGTNSGGVYLSVRTGLNWPVEAGMPIFGVPKGGYFGDVMAADGDVLVVGAPQEVYAGLRNPGAAYIYVRDDFGWYLSQRLAPSNPSEHGSFGSAVAVDGGTIVIGEKGADHFGGERAGTAHIFTKIDGTWQLHQTLIPVLPEADADFGWAVALEDDVLLVGAPRMAQQGYDYAGAVYVYERSGQWWIEHSLLVADDPLDYEYFGECLEIFNRELLIGTPKADLGSLIDAGAVYRFSKFGATWVQQQKIVVSDGAAGDFFGVGIAVSGHSMLVGAPGRDPGGVEDAGAVVVFGQLPGGWIQKDELQAFDATSDQGFGGSVASAGGVAVIGASIDSHDGVYKSGAGYVFHERDGQWTGVAKLVAAEPERYDRFGTSAAASPHSLVLGGYWAGFAGISNTGAALVFDAGSTVFADGFESGDRSRWSESGQ